MDHIEYKNTNHTCFSRLGKTLQEVILPGTLCIVSGRPGMGKTSLLGQISQFVFPNFIFLKGKLTVSAIHSAAHTCSQLSGILVLDNDSERMMSGNELKAIAEEHHIPIIISANISRKCEEREDKRPILSDLRSDLAESANIVIAIYRDSYYKCISSDSDNKSEISILKNANGSLQTIPMTFCFSTRSWKEV